METALARASIYNFLAAAFGDLPTPVLLTAWEQALPGLQPASLDEMRLAYTRLFVGPGPAFVPPYASLYRHDERSAATDSGNDFRHLSRKVVLWGPEAVAVEVAYHEAGLEIAPGQPRVPDHLALELQFMQHLCARQADAEARGDPAGAVYWYERQCAFLRDHLQPWLPNFVARLDAAETEAERVYRALAVLTLAYVQWEATDHC